MEYAGEIGNIYDRQCKANSFKMITKTVCRNNCKYYDRKKKKCKLGYGYRRTG